MKIRATDFHAGSLPTYTLRIEAGGYEPFVTNFLDLTEGGQKLTVAMIPCGPAKGMAFYPNGEPAAGARIWVWLSQDSVAGLSRDSRGQYYGDGLGKTVVEKNGEFTLPVASPDSTVIFTGENGFLKTTRKEIERTHEARLQPWGHVEGVLNIAGQVKGGVQVELRPLLRLAKQDLHLFYTMTTLPDGGFAFSNVPAGEYRLSRQISMRVGRVITEDQVRDHQMPLVVKAGETTRIEYSNSGRAVVGQARSDRPELAVDWMNDEHTLTLKQLAVSAVNAEDFTTRKAFLKALDRSYQAPGRLQQAREARTYELGFKPDGSFRAEDIPPGTYELRIHVAQPKPGDGFNSFDVTGNELGSLTREVVVPPGDTPFDLGTLVVSMREKKIIKPNRLRK